MYNTLDYLRRSYRFVNNILRPKKKKLSTLMIYATDLCDSACKHCMIWTKRPVKHLPFKKIVELMQSRCVSKHTKVGLEGGEFLLHPEADKILSWFSKHHPNFDLLSNCLKADQVIKAVQQYPPKRLYISLDGNRESYKYMRGKDGYDNVLKVIKQCKELVPISVMFTLSPFNDFADLDHVIGICQEEDIDIRLGIYNDIDFFETIEKAHTSSFGDSKNEQMLRFRDVVSLRERSDEKQEKDYRQEYERIPITENSKYQSDFHRLIPQSIHQTTENYDYLLLYDEWRKNNSKLKCYSILDSLVIHPNGDVPICQNLSTKLGNIYKSSLDKVFNSTQSHLLQHEHVHNCNNCWINFHRKYDIVMLRTLERFLPKRIIELLYGKYQWCFDKQLSYQEFLDKHKSS